MTNMSADKVLADLQSVARCIYIAAPEDAADDIAAKVNAAISLIQSLQAQAVSCRNDALEAAARISDGYGADECIGQDIRGLKSAPPPTGAGNEA